MNPASESVSPEYCATCQAQVSCPFSALPLDASAQFRILARVRTYARGSTIFWQGEYPSGLHLIRSGYIKVFHLTCDGRATALEFLGPGAVLDLVEILTRTAYEVSAVTLVESHLEYVEKGEFRSFLSNNPVLGLRLLELLSQRMRKSQSELYAISSRLPAGERLLRRLRDLSETCGQPTADGIKFGLPLTAQDLGDSIGCSRPWTSRQLRHLEVEGLIRRKRVWITLTPPAATGGLARRHAESDPAQC